MFKDYQSYLIQKGFNHSYSERASLLPFLDTILDDKQKSKTLFLITAGGKNLWEKIPNKNSIDPIDSYSIQTMNELADEFFDKKIEILFPNNDYLLPLQQIGRHFNLCAPTPLGPDISFHFGLWFSFRGVFLADSDLINAPKEVFKSPCTPCEKPCLKESEFHLARRLCPIHKEHEYTKEQQNYHFQVLQALKSKI